MSKNIDSIYTGLKIDMTWVVGTCRRILEERIIKKLSSLILWKGDYDIRTFSTKYNKDYIILHYDKSNNSYHLVGLYEKDINTDKFKNEVGSVKVYKSFDKIPYREVTPNKVLNAISIEELLYGIPHDKAVEKFTCGYNIKKFYDKITNKGNPFSLKYWEKFM